MQDNKGKGKAEEGNLLTFFSRYRLLVFRVVTISARVTIKTRREIGNEAWIFIPTSGVFSERTLKWVFFKEIYLHSLPSEQLTPFLYSCRCPKLFPRLLCHVTKHCKPWRNVGMRTSTCSARTQLLVLRWRGTKGKRNLGLSQYLQTHFYGKLLTLEWWPPHRELSIVSVCFMSLVGHSTD